MEVVMDSWSIESPVKAMPGKENNKKVFTNNQVGNPMVITPVKSPLLEAWHSAKKKHSTSSLSQGPVRIPTPTKTKKNTTNTINIEDSPNRKVFNKSPLRIPVGNMEFNLNNVAPSKASSAKPRFATPTKASKAAAAYVAANLKEKEKHQNSSSYLINLISPSPTKTTPTSVLENMRKTPISKHSVKKEMNTISHISPSSSEPPLRKKSIGTPIRKKSLSDRKATPTRRSGTPSRSPAIVSSTTDPSPLSFMKSTASSRNSSYAGLAASPSTAAVAQYIASSSSRINKEKQISTSQSNNNNVNRTSPAMRKMKNLVATITPSPPQHKSHQDEYLETNQTSSPISANLSENFDMAEFLATIQQNHSKTRQEILASKEKNKKAVTEHKNNDLDTTLTPSSCGATAGGSSSEDKSSSDEMAMAMVNNLPSSSSTKTKTQTKKMMKSPTKTNKKSSMESPIRKKTPWVPASVTPKKKTSSRSHGGELVANNDLFLNDMNDGSLSPISKRKQFLLHNQHKQVLQPPASPAPFAAKPAPYIASPPPPPSASAARKQQQASIDMTNEQATQQEQQEANDELINSFSLNLNANVGFSVEMCIPDDEVGAGPLFSSNSSITPMLDSRTEEFGTTSLMKDQMNAAGGAPTTTTTTTTTIAASAATSSVGLLGTTMEETMGSTLMNSSGGSSIYEQRNVTNHHTDNDDDTDNVVGNLLMMMNTSTNEFVLSTMSDGANGVTNSENEIETTEVETETTAADVEVEDSVIETATSSSLRESDSFSLNGFPSPVKTPHGFPIQSKPRIEIKNPVSIMLEKDMSRDIILEGGDSSLDCDHDQGSMLTFNINENNSNNTTNASGFVTQPFGSSGAFSSLLPTALTTRNNDMIVVEESKTPSPPILSTQKKYEVLDMHSLMSQDNLKSLPLSLDQDSPKALPSSSLPSQSVLSSSPCRYISADPLTTKAVSHLIRPLASPVTSPEPSPRMMS